jgi:hypothetical protein
MSGKSRPLPAVQDAAAQWPLLISSPTVARHSTRISAVPLRLLPSRQGRDDPLLGLRVEFCVRRNGTTQAGDAAPVQPAAVLLPVSIETAEVDRPSIGSTSSMRASSGIIEIEIGNARVRLRGGVDEANLRTVLVALRDLA